MGKEPFDRYFARYFPEGGNALIVYHAELAARLPEAGAVLDLGCGSNRELARYRTPSREVWGVDFQPHSDLAHPDWFRSLPADGKVPFPDNCFDIVGCCWVLEHVADPDSFLHEVRRVLRPGGVFVSVTINASHYVAWLIRLIGLFPHVLTQRLVRRLYARAEEDTFPTYYRLNTTASQRRHARRTGWEWTRLRQVANAGYFSFAPRLARWAVIVDWLLDRISPDFGRIYSVLTLRKPSSVSSEEPRMFSSEEPRTFFLEEPRTQ